MRRLSPLAVSLVLLLVLSAAAADYCSGPPGDPAPGTPAWHARELREVQCGEQRAADTAANPAFAAAELTNPPGYVGDPFREPTQLDGKRFRYRKVSFTDPEGQTLDARLFLPLAKQHRPPYPAVVVVHGGSANQEMYWWGVEPLAEAGYIVLTFQVPTAENTGPTVFPADTEAAVNWLVSRANPARRWLDPRRIRLGGHSAGGFAVSQVGQEDPRVKAIVSWDRAQSSPMRDDLPLRTPALFVTANYNCQKVPVCVPQPYSEPPDPLGPGDKDTDFQRLRAAGVDTMKISLRAATHLDFTQFGIAGSGSRYGAAVAAYYTLAWFDRYLRGTRRGARAVARSAQHRLIATTFDDSGDIHNVSG